MPKQRLYYMDFIRAIATVLIVMTHYNALFIYNVAPQRPELSVITLNISNIYIGAFGVSLFLIVSGAALMLSYGKNDKMDLKRFYSKRFQTIYPMFWIAYICFFLFSVFKDRGLNHLIPKWKFIYSFLGIDGYMCLMRQGEVNFFRVGEWFLGFILIIYLIFPLLIWLIKKAPIVLAVLIATLYCVAIYLGQSTGSVFVRLPEIVFGMYFMKYYGGEKSVKWYAALIAFAVLVANTVLRPQFSFIPAQSRESLQTTYVGIAAFILLAYLARFFTARVFRNISSTICKYSYACFLIHHQIIYMIMLKFNLSALARSDSYLMFVFCCLVIAAASYALFHLNEKVVAYIKDCFKKEQTE